MAQDAHDAPKHDYHLVNPSPWPLIGSLAGVIMAVGLVIWFKGLFGLPKGTPWVFAAGFALTIYVMAGWWRDVIKESRSGDHTPVVQIGLRYGMILFIASEVMFFAAWFWMFFEMALFPEQRVASSIEEVRAAWEGWPPRGVEVLDPWHLPLLNTLLLLTSGTTVTWAHHALQTGDRRGARMGLLLTIILGALFTGVQAFEYYHIIHDKAFFNEEAAN
jgi:cytochrome c oxidase subunit 3